MLSKSLLSWSLEPGLLPRVPDGPHCGKSWALLDDPALQDLAGASDIDVRFSAGTQLKRRKGNGIAAPDQQVVEAIHTASQEAAAAKAPKWWDEPDRPFKEPAVGASLLWRPNRHAL